MPHPLLKRRNRINQINTSIRRQARRDAHRVTEAANLLVHGILGATEDQYDAVMDVELDDMKLDLDNNFRGPVDLVDDSERVIEALVRHAKKKLKDLIQRKVQQVDFRVNVLLYHNESQGWPDECDIPDDVLEDESIVDYFVRVYVLPRINKAFEEMTNALDGDMVEFDVTEHVSTDVASLSVSLSLRPEPLPVVRQNNTIKSSCLQHREEFIACLPCGHWMSLDAFQIFGRTGANMRDRQKSTTQLVCPMCRKPARSYDTIRVCWVDSDEIRKCQGELKLCEARLRLIAKERDPNPNPNPNTALKKVLEEKNAQIAEMERDFDEVTEEYNKHIYSLEAENKQLRQGYANSATRQIIRNRRF